MEKSNVYQFLSDLEKKVYSWLIEHGILFSTQQKMFGYSGELGSATIDFVLTEFNIVIRVMGEYYHSNTEAKSRDAFGKEQLINAGYIVVDIWESDIDTPEKLNRTMELAITGVEVPR